MFKVANRLVTLPQSFVGRCAIEISRGYGGFELDAAIEIGQREVVFLGLE